VLLPIDPISDGIVVFTASQHGFTRSWEKSISSSVLDEDPGPVIRKDEIRAVVTLTPIPPTPLVRESNLVERGEPVVGGG
jgi:hypothetical protein